MENCGVSSKDEILLGGERLIGIATRHRHFFVSRSVEDGTRCWGGLELLSPWDGFCVFKGFDMGCILSTPHLIDT